jgi:hypothetical protein
METAVTARGVLLLLCFCGSACTPTPLPDTAVMPRSVAGTPFMSDEGAIQLAAYALGSPSRTRDNPVQGARAIAAIDYLAGALYSNPRWDRMSATPKQLMLQGRVEVRQVVGIPPAARSQEVVDLLLAASNALAAQNTAAARAALSNPAFTLGPQATEARLANLPSLPQANRAAQRANTEVYPRGRNCVPPC